LAWLPNPYARGATAGGEPLNVAALLQGRGTVYFLAAEDGSTASMVAALTGSIAREARRIADLGPGGRLDPSLLLALDEAALICPVPLQRWSADMSSRGVQIIAAFQSRAQAIGRWGTTGAAELINNAGAVVLFGGRKDQNDLTFWSHLFGERDEEVLTTNSPRCAGESRRPEGHGVFPRSAGFAAAPVLTRENVKLVVLGDAHLQPESKKDCDPTRTHAKNPPNLIQSTHTDLLKLA
jgi:type IV secretory pathway TraG/TraD family ATPase VirD4